MKILRDYQMAAIRGNEQFPGIVPSLEQHRSTLLVLPTGAGKTVVLAAVAANWTNGNVLCLAHRIELVDQMAETLKGELGYKPACEQGQRGVDPESMFSSGGVIVGSVQSMITDNRMRKFSRHPFGLIIVDEAHRATSPSYLKLVDRYRALDPQMRVLGVTATPRRTDGTALGMVFDSVAYEMTIVDGIDAGWLVDIHQKFAVVQQLKLDDVPMTRNEFGEMDFQIGALDKLLTQEGPLHEMSRPVLDSTERGEQAIIFASSVNHAHVWTAVLNHYRPGSAAAVDGTMLNTPDGPRQKIVKDYKAGNLQFLLNYGVFGEGFDAPNTSYVVMGRPTKSLLVYQQMLGRCTRPLPGVVDGKPTPEERKDSIAASAKPFATVLDFVGNSKLKIVSATDVLGGNYAVNVRDKADEIIGAKGNANVRDALNKAKANMLLEEEEERRLPVREAVAAVDLRYNLSDVDPFGSNGKSTPRKHKGRGGSTDAQVAALVNLGVSEEIALGYARKQAGAIMTSLRQKRCTVKQAATLRKFGYDPEKFNSITATEQISAIAANGWKRP